jgi:hypothetical protein
MTTEEKILDASIFIFLQYGYHWITIQKIAKKAEVNQDFPAIMIKLAAFSNNFI